jgi:TPR repeat protein
VDDPATLANGGVGQASGLRPDASRTQEILKSASDIERAARAAGSPTEAIRLWREVDAEPDASVAFAGVPMTASGIHNNNYQYGTLSEAQEYANGLAQARLILGSYYQSGGVVRQDYTEAAAWYQKASDTTDPNGNRTLFGNVAAKNLGLLYAYGLGVPQNRATARQLWETWPAGSGGNRDLLRLLDADELPKTMVGNDHFSQEIQDALARLDAAAASRQAAADRGREKEEKELELRAAIGKKVALECVYMGDNKSTGYVVLNMTQELVTTRYLTYDVKNVPFKRAGDTISWSYLGAFTYVFEEDTKTLHFDPRLGYDWRCFKQ